MKQPLEILRGAVLSLQQWWSAARWPGGAALKLPGGARLWITLLSMGFLMAAMLSNGRQLVQLRPDPQGWLWLLLAVGVSLLSLLVNGLAWLVVLRWLRLRPCGEALVTLFIATNLRKYLPGGIWHLTSRVQELRTGVANLMPPTGTGMALVAVLIEPLLAAVAALALVTFGGWQRGLALLCLLPLGLLLPRWLQPLLGRLESKRARELGLEGALADEGVGALKPVLPGYPWGPLLAELSFVFIRFAGFACCVAAFDLLAALDWGTWLAGFGLAWTVGLVVPGAPGGFGVFETVLLLRLSQDLDEPALLAVGLSYRLVTTLADLLGAGLVNLDRRLRLRLAPRETAA